LAERDYLGCESNESSWEFKVIDTAQLALLEQ
jgi:hypothetical protein